MTATTSSCHSSSGALILGTNHTTTMRARALIRTRTAKSAIGAKSYNPPQAATMHRRRLNEEDSVTDAVQPRFVSLAPDTRPVPRTDFERALHKLLDDAFALEPVWATDIGFHAYDDRWPD